MVLIRPLLYRLAGHKIIFTQAYLDALRYLERGHLYTLNSVYILYISWLGH